MMPRTRTIQLALGVSLLVGVTACSSATDATSTIETAADEPGVVKVTAVDFSYEDLPETVEAGTQLVMTNDSTGEVHELVAVRLDDDSMSVGDFVQLPQDQLGPYLASPAAVLIAPPNSEAIPVVGDGTLTEPGRYAIICLIPTGAIPDEYMMAAAEAEGGPPDVAGGPPHIAQGMFAEITVEG